VSGPGPAGAGGLGAGSRRPRRRAVPPAGRQPAADVVLLDVGGVFCLPGHAEVLAALARAGVEVDPERLDHAHYLALAASEPPGGDSAAGDRMAAGDRPAGDRVTEGDRAAGDQAAAGDGTAGDRAAGDRAAAAARYRTAYLRAAGVPADRLDPAAAELFDGLGFRVRWTRLRAGSLAELRALARTGVALAVVSNAEGMIERQLRDLGVCQVGPGPGVAMAAIVDSTVVGVAKPDPRIFAIALDAAGVPAARAVHVGDMLSTDVAGARAAGVRPLHYDPYQLCRGGDHEDVAALTELVPLLALG
jgi:putative hydrolase of the HAD superfamily